MQKLYSEIIGLPVFDEYSQRPVSLVQDVIIDPENGKVLAYVVKGKHLIVPMDILRMHNGIYIHDKDHILPFEEVLRAAEVARRYIGIIGACVITERGKVILGRAVDYEIDTTHMVLTKLHVAKLFLFFRYQEKIISYAHIVRIEHNTIIVKDSHEVKVEEKAMARSAFAS